MADHCTNVADVYEMWATTKNIKASESLFLKEFLKSTGVRIYVMWVI